jgi:YVTN family beta-propeller protein
MKSLLPVILFMLVMIFSCNVRKEEAVPNLKVGPQPDGSILVPSNQLLRPAGFQVDLPGRPVDIALTPNGRFLLVKNKSEINLIRLTDRTVLQSLPYRNAGASFTGMCVSPDGKKVYVTDAKNHICIASIGDDNVMRWEEPVTLPDPVVGGMPFPGGLVCDNEGGRILVAISRNNSLGVVNLKDNRVTEIPVGVSPYDVIIAGKKAYVSNWGGRRPVEGETVRKSSDTDVLIDPETGIASNGSVSVVDLQLNREVKDITVGLHPCGMALSPDGSRLYVACSNSDIIAVIDTQTDEVTSNISVHSEEGAIFGSSPNDLTLSPDGSYLYVANGTDNAVCVISTVSQKVLGYIPTGWYPGAVITNRQGNILYVANVKGTGSRNQRTDRQGYNSHDHLGSISIIGVPGERELKEMTGVVGRNNSFLTAARNPERKAGSKPVPVPDVTGQPSVFKHVVYIIKENRTYDQVLGDMKQGDGDSSLVMFGREVTPNHHKLAETFVLLDNYYCSGILSADGHQWTDEAFVTDYLEKSFGDFARSYPYDGDDPLAYASSGFIWDNVLRKGLTFRDYGEFVNAVIEPPASTFSDIYQDYISKTGKITIKAKANIDQMEPYICPTFIGFPSTVTDQYRADEFIKELAEFEKNGNFPNFIIMLLPNDHTSGTRPGMPTPQAAVADNDLALGRVVEAISKSSFWKETCILVTEDDPQNGFDHVDGHRTVGFVISPYTKRGEVVSTYYSQINMVKTIENILGLPPMNQLDMAAEAMTACFTDKPDFTPYEAVPNNIPIDRLNPPLTSLSGDQLYWAKKSLEQDLDDVDRIEDDTFNRIIWHAVRGYATPYPDLRK